MADPLHRRTPRGGGRRPAAPRLVPAVLAVALLAGCGDTAATTSASGGATATGGLHGAVLDERYTLADATLTDTSGGPFDLRGRLEEELTLVFFGYTHCPDICQAVLADLASTMARLSPEDAQRVQVWFVTTDPARDDPATLRAYLDRFDPRFEGLTGELATVLEVARSVHVAVEKGPRLETGGYDVTHGTPVLAVDRDGEVPLLWTEGTSAAKIAEDVTAVLAGGVPAREG